MLPIDYAREIVYNVDTVKGENKASQGRRSRFPASGQGSENFLIRAKDTARSQPNQEGQIRVRQDAVRREAHSKATHHLPDDPKQITNTKENKTMANNELLNKIQALNEWEALLEEARAEAEAIRDEIKQHILPCFSFFSVTQKSDHLTL